MKSNFREKLASVLIAGYLTFLTLIGAGIYSFRNDNSSNNKKVINFNNKEYLVSEGGVFNTFYHITSPPTNLDVPPRPGALFEYYIGKKTDNDVLLLDYGKFNNDTLRYHLLYPPLFRSGKYRLHHSH